MNPKYTFERITKADFDKLLAQYARVLPSKLQDLDHERLKVIPEQLQQRKKSKDGTYLEKDELVTLVKWKLSHGTFRPRLLSLATANTAVPTISRTAFALVPSPLPSPLSPSTLLPALKHLCILSGVGPATASLLLSSLCPDHVPFFSDELFRWAMWDGPAGKDGRKGWDRGIGYTNKEYGGLVERVGELRARLGVGAVAAEMVGYVLGKTGGEGLGEDDGGEEVKGDGEGGGKKKGLRKTARPSREEVERMEAEEEEEEEEEEQKPKEKKIERIETDGKEGPQRRSKRVKLSK
ncbi:hypothetical protein CAC42_6542 [Sphaceloma murrayae]|uniref:Uncharacterized protein n=1 Tax=Sphaceloma murrayae TaxID=2082308 RepID=A0A2K1QGK7_9PEZI|nr:hypothetical protein CAC42_6542 [Sphaceloma murrayae]